MAGAAPGGMTANPMQQASMAQQGALAGTAANMMYAPGQVQTSFNTPMVGTGGTTPMVQAGQLASTDIGQYQNPYTQQVIEANEADILRGAQQGINALDYQAGRAGAFGGSRHGVALGELGTGVARQLAQSSAGLRQAGFNQAQQMAQQDIGTRMQAGLANQGAAAQDLARRLQAQGMNQAAIQAGQGMGLGAQQFNVQTGLQGAQQRLGAAQQLGALGQTSFQTGRTIQQDLAQQGAMQQALQQALIDAGKAQYAGYTGAPAAGLGYTVQALGAAPTPVTTTQSRQPGLFDYLTLAATGASGTNFGN